MTGAEGLPLAVASGVVSYNEQDPETQGGERIASLPDIIVSILSECLPAMLCVPARQQSVFTPTRPVFWTWYVQPLRGRDVPASWRSTSAAV